MNAEFPSRAILVGDQAEQLIAKLGIVIGECRPGLVVGTMPVSGNRQPVGIMHGGANAAFAETLGSFAAWQHCLSCRSSRVAVAVLSLLCSPEF